MINPHDHPIGFIAVLASIGAAVGFGKVLDSSEPLTVRLAFGRAITHGGIGAAAGATTLLFPSADPIVLLGVAAALASAGVSVLQALLTRFPGRSSGTPNE